MYIWHTSFTIKSKQKNNNSKNEHLLSVPLPFLHFLNNRNNNIYASSLRTNAVLTHHVVQALWCKLSWHFLYCFFKHREGLLWKKQIRKANVGDVCITERRDPARGAGVGVTSHSSPAAGALTLWIHSVELGVAGRLVHTETSRKGLSSVSWLLRWLVWCHILILGCIECRFAIRPWVSRSLHGRRSRNYFIAALFPPACQLFIKTFTGFTDLLLHCWLNQQHQWLCAV